MKKEFRTKIWGFGYREATARMGFLACVCVFYFESHTHSLVLGKSILVTFVFGFVKKSPRI